MTSTFTPSIDLDEAGKLLRRVEAHHAGEGWHPHANPHGYLIYDHHDVVTGHAIAAAMHRMGDPVRNARYTAQAMLPARVFQRAQNVANLQPYEALRSFALNVAYADSPGLTGVLDEGLHAYRNLIRMPGILGFAFCYEIHLIGGPGAREGILRAATGSTRIEHLPGAKEARLALMVDVHDRVHVVRRCRDETAELEQDVTLVGDVTGSLRMLTDTAMNRVPQDQASFDLRYEGIRQKAGRDGWLSDPSAG